ncbi:MAG: hypothetical protein AB1586_07700 [Pseudomonadota bacterium]
MHAIDLNLCAPEWHATSLKMARYGTDAAGIGAAKPDFSREDPDRVELSASADRMRVRFDALAVADSLSMPAACVVST